MKEANSFGTRLAQLRREAGLSQQALADRLSVTRQAVSNWERDQTLPDLEMLRAIAQALGTDLNTLSGSDAPVRRRRYGKKAVVFPAVLVCCLLCAAVGWRLTHRPAETAEVSTPAPHKIQYVTADGVTVTTAADGWEELREALAALPEPEPGPVKPSAQLRDTFVYVASQYELRFVPGFDPETGTFTSWNEVLYWLYKAGISGGGVLTEEQVDATLTRFFGTGLTYEHQSTGHFTRTGEGYVPEGVSSDAGGPYTLDSLVCLEPGIYEAVLREEDGPTITLTLEEGETLLLRAVTRTEP